MKVSKEVWDKAQEYELDDSDKHLMNGYKWFINSNGYICRNPKMKDYEYENIERYLHRLVAGAKEGEIVDHINRNRLDNRRSNLRIVTKRQNALNRSTKLNKSTGVRGVRKVGNKFRAYIRKDNKQIHLGYYKTLEKAYKVWREEYDKGF